MTTTRQTATGTLRCCGGYGEHFDSCAVGDAISNARQRVARAGVTRREQWMPVPGTQLTAGPDCAQCGGFLYSIAGADSENPEVICVGCNPSAARTDGDQ